MTGPSLTLLPHDPILDLDTGIGQRSCTFRFQLINGVTGQHLGDITPIRAASLVHDTTRTIKRQLLLPLGVEDTAAINTITDRVLLFMVMADGTEYPLGRYMFTDASRVVSTAGRLGAMSLNDEMFLVDQEILVGINGFNKAVITVIQEALKGLPVSIEVAPTPFTSTEAWGIGTGRGQILESLSISGDYFSPWFDNHGVMQFIRSFDPSSKIADLDYDTGFKVHREQILETDDLLTAPNRFVVISNAALNPEVQVVGTADVPTNAPHSIQNRGFVIARTLDIQLSATDQAHAVAQGLANRQTVFERVSLNTPPDPRHDSYNVIRWQGELWLELAWSMALTEGGGMAHLLRKSYS
jgi:hypothetical protein